MPWWAHCCHPGSSSSSSDLVLLSLSIRAAEASTLSSLKGKWSLWSVFMISLRSKQSLWLSCLSCHYVLFCPISCSCSLRRKDWASFLPPVRRPEGDCLWPVFKLVTCGPDQQGCQPPNLATYMWGATCAIFPTSACQLWAHKASSLEPANMSRWFTDTWWFSCVLRWLRLSPILPPPWQ